MHGADELRKRNRGIAAQSVGLSQAATMRLLAYAMDRKQFGKEIINFPAV